MILKFDCNSVFFRIFPHLLLLNLIGEWKIYSTVILMFSLYYLFNGSFRQQSFDPKQISQQQQIQQLSANINEKQTGSRRGSFRIPTQDDFQKDESPSPDNGPTLLIDDDRRMRRRGSQL